MGGSIRNKGGLQHPEAPPPHSYATAYDVCGNLMHHSTEMFWLMGHLRQNTEGSNHAHSFVLPFVVVSYNIHVVDLAVTLSFRARMGLQTQKIYCIVMNKGEHKS